MLGVDYSLALKRKSAKSYKTIKYSGVTGDLSVHRKQRTIPTKTS